MSKLERLNEINSDLANMLLQTLSTVKKEEFIVFLTQLEFSWEQEQAEELYESIQKKLKQRQEAVDAIASSDWSATPYSEQEKKLLKARKTWI